MAIETLGDWKKPVDILEYIREQRRLAFYGPGDPAFVKGWTEDEWIKVGRHVDVATGTIVYHSYSDYCD